MTTTPHSGAQGAHEGSDPASAEANDAAAGAQGGGAPPKSEPSSFAQLGLDGSGAKPPPRDHPEVGAAEALPPDRALDLNEIAADDVGATHMAERASEQAKGRERPS